MFKISLQKRIYLFLISFVLLSFVLIGTITIIFFSNENERYHAERLLRKERTVLASINFFLRSEEGDIFPFYTRDFSKKIEEIAEINQFDINVYDLNGELITSTRMEYFEKNILPWQMKDIQLKKLQATKSSILESEAHGEDRYLTTYSYIHNKNGQPLAIVNIPYFSDQTLNKQEVTSFLTSMTNIYALLLIGALLLAYFISSSITKPLRVLRDKMKEVSIEKHNEPIHWKVKDEVGALIEQYNSMVEELEHSAELLAKSERESAWREMAKQVAHEIKNPLTPMKLSVQQLERAWGDQQPDFEERMRRFSKTMIEQIETLSNIATEFSHFAKMPKAQNEAIDLSEVIKSTISLHDANENVSISLKGEQDVGIFADPKAMSRVFINLIKNSIQAIDDGQKGDILIEIASTDGKAVVKVSDNGHGIPEHRKEDIFLPNFTTKSSGMGLGLSMAKSIVENAGGSITFDSREGEGSTFIVELPKNES